MGLMICPNEHDGGESCETCVRDAMVREATAAYHAALRLDYKDAGSARDAALGGAATFLGVPVDRQPQAFRAAHAAADRAASTSTLAAALTAFWEAR